MSSKSAASPKKSPLIPKPDLDVAKTAPSLEDIFGFSEHSTKPVKEEVILPKSPSKVEEDPQLAALRRTSCNRVYINVFLFPIIPAIYAQFCGV
jgi:hypothetical protein